MKQMSSRLLIVDDDRALLNYYTDALSAFDVQIDCVQNGYAALRQIGTQHYDLVLLDIAMPKMSGLEMLHAISEMPQMNLPLTVVISSLNQKELVMQALTYGASAYLFKPIDAGELKDLVEQYIGMLKEKTKVKPLEEAQASELADPGRDAAQREVFSLENQQRKKSQYESLSQAMASMVFQKITGTLCVETQLGVGKLSYMRGKLKKVELLGQSGIEALEALKKLPALSITLEP